MNDDNWQVRDLFPSRPAERSSITYPAVERLADAWMSPVPRWRRVLRAWRARGRLWWRRHWWPARIRDLERALERYREWEE